VRFSRVLRVALATGIVASVVALGGSAHAAGGSEKITSFAVDITIESTGSIFVHETINYDFGFFPRHGIFRNIPVTFDYPKKADTNRVYELSDIKVKTSEGTPSQYDQSDFDQNGIGYTQLKIGDPNKTITGAHTYDISYRVKGALNGFADHDELYWNAIGNEWPVTIDEANVSVHSPAPITKVLCFWGSFGETNPCDGNVASGTTASFSQTNLFPSQGLTFVVSLPKGAVPVPKPILEERWTVGRAFAVNSTTGPVAGGLLAALVAIFGVVFYRYSRDRRAKGSTVDQAFANKDAPQERVPLFEHTETPVEFVPPDGMRPGEIGTLIDFTANPLDVTATIVDLAVRKYLVIEEVDSGSKWQNDWKLTKKKDPDKDLKTYESDLLTALFRDGDEQKLSDLKYEFSSRMRKVQKGLTDEAKEAGWFTHDPSGARAQFGCLGVVILIVGVVATVLLAAFTHAGLLGIPIILLAILVIVLSYLAPARTATGYGLLRHVNGFRRFIEESEKSRAQFAEKKNLFSEYLPYAIVFGATDKWAKAFAGLDGEPPDTTYWYRSTTPFQFVAFSNSINGFTVTTAGTLTSSPPSTSGSSGFSGGGGGGFSGGGGGGGGGGSW
jgi:uncharacterized membrane protein YgcG